ncbi:hypothetical protein AB0G04_17060 [Actinoplanes sp. NPDC023801]|uniref:hypothetical protein n=1 Tax=Actinoplanes sp. NPDC023801 TaxID=3154595 RepID=UPI0033E73D89
MIQLLGGVAVAGVVAAGSTAFTAAGVTSTVGSSKLVGGTVTQAIHGAKMIKLALTTAAAPNSNRVEGTITMELETDATAVALDATDVVTVALTGTASVSPAASIANCAQGSGKVWTCAITGYYTNVTAINVTVAPAP